MAIGATLESSRAAPGPSLHPGLNLTISSMGAGGDLPTATCVVKHWSTFGCQSLPDGTVGYAKNSLPGGDECGWLSCWSERRSRLDWCRPGTRFSCNLGAIRHFAHGQANV